VQNGQEDTRKSRRVVWCSVHQQFCKRIMESPRTWIGVERFLKHRRCFVRLASHIELLGQPHSYKCVSWIRIECLSECSDYSFVVFKYFGES
jgi:hypothetical protein